MDIVVFFEEPLVQQLFISAGLGATIGFERELAGKDPSLRTFSLICLGSCVFTQLSALGSTPSFTGDQSRIASQIVTGIGFLGAGSIFRSERGVSGLTTAALMWVTSGIGMAAGFGRIEIATTTALIALIISFSLRAVHYILDIVGLSKSQ